ncbi:MAG TPA: PAS domain-containing methyl-accepting chemotaxis protein [Acetobacteraceae bacterium]|nr:PAS domain-containing methyl-accepting chemotaxis protein [Acetobacteraceae bacterium]
MLDFLHMPRDSVASAEAKLAALDRAQAIIEFASDGTIIKANENFLRLLGYQSAEVIGRKHAIFVEPSYAESADYRKFWDELRAGRPSVAEFKRIAKDGHAVWIQGSYNPVLGPGGKVVRVIKAATDVTRRKLAELQLQGQVDAIDRSQARIEFALDGTVLEANENFLALMGYRLDEIKGRHHSMFVDPAERTSTAYSQFWDALRGGRFQTARYKRFGKGSKPVWLQASYNPILDAEGKPCRVVKIASDVTEQVTLLANVKTLIEDNMGAVGQEIGRTELESQSAAERLAETTGAVQMVASGAEEMAASVGEIAGNMAKSRDATDRAFEQAVAANEASTRLSEAAQAMSGIVETIEAIASQINLLALNATIEAARAGDAGRGFAVVASEVKSLAGQAGEATSRISSEIDGIRSVAATVASALAAIRASVEGVREYVTSAASAVEEQTAVTRDMSANMQSVAGAVGTINENMGQITRAVAGVNEAVAKTRDAALSLTS